MASLLEYVGSVHIFLGPYRGNPIALYLRRTESGCQIGPKVYPWNDVTGIGETPNKAAADFEEKWKTKGLTADMYSGPSWEGGIKPEKPAPPKPAAPPKVATPPPTPAAPAGTVPTPPATTQATPGSASAAADVSPAPAAASTTIAPST
jgi:Predicted membrane protein